MKQRALTPILWLLMLTTASGWVQADGMPDSPSIEKLVAPALQKLVSPTPAMLAGTKPAASPTKDVKDVSEGDNLFYRISETEPTRLSIEGGRIAALNYIQQDLDVSQDNALGQAYLRPRTLDKVITLYVTTNTNTTVTLTLQPTPGPATSIRLRDVKLSTPERRGDTRQTVPNVASDYARAVESLITVAAKDIDVSGVDVIQLNQPVLLWEGVDFVLRRKHSAHNMAVETYTLKNISSQPLRVVEQEFYAPSVAAVAVELHEIAPNETTLVFVARWLKD